ncbi:transmembrane protein 26-like [Gigantopelta aegis]|uniref:transmembrane protein 26-like n=1 Tax=Gigantopelta aegis TaxID=1735272 RepID=UPI001B88996E|nr:transmembrane protein 26-like [Gigantopelta aegis]
MSCMSIFRAITARLLFSIHGIITIWRLYLVTKDTRYWYLACVLGFLLIEMTVTLGKKGGKEWKWFCPSLMIYLMCVVPAIWFLELHEMDRRIREKEKTTTNNTEVTYNDSIEQLSANLGSVLGVRFEIRIPLSLTSDEWIRTLEQILLLVLILGRWFLPKGKLTHDQLSQLLLVYIGTAADIIEFFEAFKEDQVKYNRILCITILGIWSLSLIQFSLVLTASRARRDQSGLVMKRESPDSETIGCCSPDVYGIIISILMQDLPFLVLRMLLIFRYSVLSYTNMFFTSKNTIVIILLIYRLIVVQIEKRNAKMKDKYGSAFDDYKNRGKRIMDSLSLAESASSGTGSSHYGSRAKLIHSVSCHSNGFLESQNVRRTITDSDKQRLARTLTMENIDTTIC